MNKFKFKMRFFAVFVLLLIFPAISASAQTSGHTLDDDMLYRINFGSADDVRVLLEKGANPNTRNRQGETPLEVAIQRNDAESAGIALALIEKGADIDERDKNGNPPIIDAIRYKQNSVVRELLNRGVDFHTKSSDGIALIDFAKVNSDSETLKMIQDMIDKENAYASALHDPNRFKDIVQIYTMDSCLYQYWSFFLSSRQAPDKDPDTKKKIETVKKVINQLIVQIQQYYSSASTTALHNVSSKAVQNIYNLLNRMVSNRNRLENGVGTEEDAKSRCEKVVEGLHIEFVPAVLSNGAAQPAAAAPAPVKGAPPPMPMEAPHR